jgi:hypothetical protein
MKKEKWKKLPIEVRQIIFDLAVSFGFGRNSTINEIDYKFWEDTSPGDIAIDLALKLDDAKKKQLSDVGKPIKPTKEQMDYILSLPKENFKYADKVIIETLPMFEKAITKEKMAEMLNERLYRDEITGEEEELARKNGLVVVFGASDLMEMRGAIDDEFGTEVFLDSNGEVIEECDDDCKYSKAAREKAKSIEGIYGKGGWTFKTSIPNAEFDIFEDGQLYGKGLVFDIESLKFDVWN